MSTNFETSNPEETKNKFCLDTKEIEINGHFSYTRQKSNEFKDFERSNKQSDENFLVERAVKMAIQILYDTRLFRRYTIVDQVLKDYLVIESC